MFEVKASTACGNATTAMVRRCPLVAAAAAPRPHRRSMTVVARDALSPAPHPAPGLDDDALDQALRAQLNTRWLPYDDFTARKALTLAAGVAAARRHAGAPGTSGGANVTLPTAATVAMECGPQMRESVARSALPVYQALLTDRLLDTWRFKPLPSTQMAQPDQEQLRVLWHERWRLANEVRILSQERAECERTLARGGLSQWRADGLASRAESLSADINAIERLLRISEGWGDALPTVPAVAQAQQQQQQQE